MKVKVPISKVEVRVVSLMYYSVITIAWNCLIMVLHCYYNCLELIDNGITLLLQLPGTD